MPDGYDNPATMRFLYGTTRTGLDTNNLLGPYVDPTRYECQEQFRYSYKTHQENECTGVPGLSGVAPGVRLSSRAVRNLRLWQRDNSACTYSVRAAVKIL
jgi:hypothetical protein